MKKIVKRSWLKLTGFVLSSFLNVISFARDKGPDLFHPGQQLSTFKINFQKIDFKTGAGIFPAYTRV